MCARKRSLDAVSKRGEAGQGALITALADAYKREEFAHVERLTGQIITGLMKICISLLVSFSREFVLEADRQTPQEHK